MTAIVSGVAIHYTKASVLDHVATLVVSTGVAVAVWFVIQRRRQSSTWLDLDQVTGLPPTGD